jgi:tRNA A37 methylthiotransferase MiaB
MWHGDTRTAALPEGTSAIAGRTTADPPSARPSTSAEEDRPVREPDLLRSAGSTKTVCIASPNACPRSEVEAALLVDYFTANDWRVSSDFRTADLILLCTCGFDGCEEERSMGFLSVVESGKKAEARVIVFGCLPGINRERLRRESGATPLPSMELERLDEIIGASHRLAEIREPHLVAEYKKGLAGSFGILDRCRVAARVAVRYPGLFLSRLSWKGRPRTLDKRYDRIFTVRVGTGCLGDCTYCAIKYAAGPLVSKPLDAIEDDFREGLGRHYSVFRLVAGDVGCYGQDIGLSVVDLLTRIFARGERFTLIWDDFSPRWFVMYFEALEPLIRANADRIGYIGLPIQSGSERILRAMMRGHTVRQFEDSMARLRSGVPDLQVTTHVIVGFPGETDEDFDDTLRLLKRVAFQHIIAYKYSDRPYTIASGMTPKVDNDCINRRLRTLRREFCSVCDLP